MSLEFSTNRRVIYADTDKMGVVYNGNYLSYFEIGRNELMRHLGLAYTEVEKNGLILPVIDAYVKYIKPAYYDDILDINECEDPNSCHQHCLNTNGSFICGCDDGFVLQADRRTQERPGCRRLQR